MSARKFKADVEAASEKIGDGLIPGVFSLRWGESDGEVVITYGTASLLSPIRIHALAQDTSEYPDGNNFTLFIESPDVPEAVMDVISQAQADLLGIKVFKMVTILATQLNTVLEPAHNTDGAENGQEDEGIPDTLGEDEEMSNVLDEDEEMSDLSYEDDDQWDDDSDDDYDTGNTQHFGLTTNMTSTPSTPVSILNKALQRRIRHDLRKVMAAGYKVGILDGLGKVSNYGMISISIRVKMLELSNEALDAWNIHDNNYIVLLIRYDGRYTSLETILTAGASELNPRFRIGICNHHRPSATSASKAFVEGGLKPSNPCFDDIPRTRQDSNDFRKTFISNSLDQFMNDSLVSLVKLRTSNISWDAANEILLAEARLPRRSSSSVNAPSAPVPEGDSNSIWRETQRKIEAEAATEAATEVFGILRHDHLLQDSAQERSFPLVAMQFAMHYFVKCTKFCLRCHRRVEKGFEALRPYVCSNPLCLYQYMALGLGPNVEDEIITQPSTVDLLVSLCYASVLVPSRLASGSGSQYSIREFPVGLRLQVPNLFGYSKVPSKAIRAHLVADTNTLAIEGRACDLLRLRVDQWVAFRRCHAGGNSSWGLTQCRQTTVYHALIRAVNPQTMSIEIRIMGTTNFEVPFDPKNSNNMTQKQAMLGHPPGGDGDRAAEEEGGTVAELYPYDVDFDSLNDTFKAIAIRFLLETLPPIREIHSHIASHPNATFRSHNKVSPPAAELLQWIICSNRSCIQEIKPSDQPEGDPRQTSALTSMESVTRARNRPEEHIPGMGSWFQFRFLQGSPDKELRFKQALQEVAARKNIAKHPTIFAWHGSSIANWHSILRSGLDFKNIAYGRAYGDGVYLSRHFTTSLHYASSKDLPCWPNSELQIVSAVSLNEIINTPDEFVTKGPIYVVSQLDWIQCRYLFVQPKTIRKTTVKGVPGPILTQAPDFEAIGPLSKALSIPIAAMPIRNVVSGDIQAPLLWKREIRKLEEDSEAEDSDDLKFILFEDDDDSDATEQMSSEPEKDIFVGIPIIDTTLTDFRPGSLDVSAIPRLAPPSWATSIGLRALGLEVKKLQAVQAKTPLHELGWYIDFNGLTNLFQWIVELHTFDPTVPFARDMKEAGITSIVLEIRFGKEFPVSPPFVRVVRPRFLPFISGGGGHVTGGGAMCMELLTNSGWSPANSMESVLVQVRLALCDLEPRPARLLKFPKGSTAYDYSLQDAVTAYTRAVNTHGWKIPDDLKVIAKQ